MLVRRGQRDSASALPIDHDRQLTTETGHIECDTADLLFRDHQLRLATITGSPATFEVQRPGSTETTYAEAGLLKYNFETGVVEFSENAIITEGGNQISSNYLTYNIAEQRINAQSDGERVRIKYTPKPTEQDGSNNTPSNDESGTDPNAVDESAPGQDGDDNP